MSTGTANYLRRLEQRGTTLKEKEPYCMAYSADTIYGRLYGRDSSDRAPHLLRVTYQNQFLSVEAFAQQLDRMIEHSKEILGPGRIQGGFGKSDEWPQDVMLRFCVSLYGVDYE